MQFFDTQLKDVRGPEMPNLNILILVIEDDKYMNETLCEVLESEGYNVESALNALDAINKIKHSEKKYQLLILDYNLQFLQGITGLDIFQIAKEIDPDVKAIMISAYGRDKELKDKASKVGISQFIDKPFLITDLVDTVDDITRKVLAL
ncbi:MAG: response regulator [Ignavibacteria bacterium]|nr:response regulator [Ignavibacteria bacterium]